MQPQCFRPIPLYEGARARGCLTCAHFQGQFYAGVAARRLRRIVVEGCQGAARTRVTASIFISYSHKDTALVEPVVALLRASRSFVYLDKDSIRPGKKWREELTN